MHLDRIVNKLKLLSELLEEPFKNYLGCFLALNDISFLIIQLAYVESQASHNLESHIAKIAEKCLVFATFDNTERNHDVPWWIPAPRRDISTELILSLDFLIINLV